MFSFGKLVPALTAGKFEAESRSGGKRRRRRRVRRRGRGGRSRT